MTKHKAVLWSVVVIALAALVFFYRDKVHFDWKNFWQQLRYVSFGHILAGIALVYTTFWLRAVRWAVFCVANQKSLSVVFGGIAVYRIHGRRFVWAVGGSHQAISHCAARGAIVELAGRRVHD